jgi:hypothetical protein
VCERTASLLDLESFPDRRKEFPVRPLKFPVPLRREFAEKALVEPALFGARSSRSEAKTAKFPVFSLMIREFDRESATKPQFSACVCRDREEVARLWVESTSIDSLPATFSRMWDRVQSSSPSVTRHGASN